MLAFPPRRHCLSQFFGFEGNIKNPWPDYAKGAEQKYQKCLALLRSYLIAVTMAVSRKDIISRIHHWLRLELKHKWD